jgi:hypothetical protein
VLVENSLEKPTDVRLQGDDCYVFLNVEEQSRSINLSALVGMASVKCCSMSQKAAFIFNVPKLSWITE